jgi:hypothetical protein
LCWFQSTLKTSGPPGGFLAQISQRIPGLANHVTVFVNEMLDGCDFASLNLFVREPENVDASNAFDPGTALCKRTRNASGKTVRTT